MKRLPSPGVDDDQIIDTLSATFDRLANSHTTIISCYENYRNESGNPKLIPAPELSEDLKDALRYYYSHPPVAASFIQEMRDDAAGETCAMCGGANPSSLDHIFPKEKYAEYSILSINLAPACGCNSKKSTALHGDGEAERILHPYFDEILETPLVAANFEDLGEAPLITLTILLGDDHPFYPTVLYHVNKVLPRKKILRFFRKRLSRILASPKRLMYWRQIQSSAYDLNNATMDEIAYWDDYTGTPNNWNSMFLRGLQMQETLSWLENKLPAALTNCFIQLRLPRLPCG